MTEKPGSGKRPGRLSPRERLVAALKDASQQGLTRSEVYSDVFRYGITSAEIDRIINALVDSGEISVTESRRPIVIRRKVTVYRLVEPEPDTPPS